MYGINSEAASPFIPFSNLNWEPAFPWAATANKQAFNDESPCDIRPPIRPTRISPVPPVASSGPPSSQI